MAMRSQIVNIEGGVDERLVDTAGPGARASALIAMWIAAQATPVGGDGRRPGASWHEPWSYGFGGSVGDRAGTFLCLRLQGVASLIAPRALGLDGGPEGACVPALAVRPSMTGLRRSAVPLQQGRLHRGASFFVDKAQEWAPDPDIAVDGRGCDPLAVAMAAEPGLWTHVDLADARVMPDASSTANGEGTLDAPMLAPCSRIVDDGGADGALAEPALAEPRELLDWWPQGDDVRTISSNWPDPYLRATRNAVWMGQEVPFTERRLMRLTYAALLAPGNLGLRVADRFADAVESMRGAASGATAGADALPDVDAMDLRPGRLNLAGPDVSDERLRSLPAPHSGPANQPLASMSLGRPAVGGDGIVFIPLRCVRSTREDIERAVIVIDPHPALKLFGLQGADYD